MRGVTLLLATVLTGTYTFAATSAIVADQRSHFAPEVTATTETGPVWYGGVLPPVTVEAPPPDDSTPLAQETCPAPKAGVAAATGTRLPAIRVS